MLLILALLASKFSLGSAILAECNTRHPVFKRGLLSTPFSDFKGVLLKATEGHNFKWYVPRSNITATPVDETGFALDKLDFLLPNGESSRSYGFHRDATVYLLKAKPSEDLVAAGWKALGSYTIEADRPKLKNGKPLRGLQLLDTGINNATAVRIHGSAQVYEKATDDNHRIDIPEITKGDFLLIGEANECGKVGGCESSTPDQPSLFDHIVPANRCPKELQDMWTASPSDFNLLPGFHDDDDLSAEFATWHPLMDPCYWCAYDQEHGSDAARLMGEEFAPMYTYAALKNGDEDEPVPGFKSFVFRLSDKHMGLFDDEYKNTTYMVSYDVHVQASQPRRFRARRHSGALTIVDVTNAEPKLMLRLTQKLDFGPLRIIEPRPGVEGKNLVRFMRPEEEVDFYEHLNLTVTSDKTRKVNSREKNFYEEWGTSFMCNNEEGRRNEIPVLKMRINNPPTAIDDHSADLDDEELNTTPLYDRGGSAQKGVIRGLKIRHLHIDGAKFCNQAIANFTETESGVFYTDPEATMMFTEPGKDRIWQYISKDLPNLRIGMFGIKNPKNKVYSFKMEDFGTTEFVFGGGNDDKEYHQFYNAVDETVN